MSKTTGNVMDPLEVNSAVIKCALPFPWLLHSCGPNLLRVLGVLPASLLVLQLLPAVLNVVDVSRVHRVHVAVCTNCDPAAKRYACI
jgi:hypothetical protein